MLRQPIGTFLLHGSMSHCSEEFVLQQPQYTSKCTKEQTPHRKRQAMKEHKASDRTYGRSSASGMAKPLRAHCARTSPCEICQHGAHFFTPEKKVTGEIPKAQSCITVYTTDCIGATEVMHEHLRGLKTVMPRRGFKPRKPRSARTPVACWPRLTYER